METQPPAFSFFYLIFCFQTTSYYKTPGSEPGAAAAASPAGAAPTRIPEMAFPASSVPSIFMEYNPSAYRDVTVPDITGAIPVSSPSSIYISHVPARWPAGSK